VPGILTAIHPLRNPFGGPPSTTPDGASVMWSAGGILGIMVGVLPCAVGVIIATLINDPRGYIQSEYGGRAIFSRLEAMALGVCVVVVGRILGARKPT
jgi:hypothetical protein